MTARRALLGLLALACASVLWATASGEGPGDPPTVQAPLPFDHPLHAETFDKAGLTCIDCHPVGLSAEAGVPTELPAPMSTCHACHRREVARAPRKATERCESCHPYRDELTPETHGLGWDEDHGPEARSLRNGCDTCHDTGMCIDCHDARGAMTASPHGAAFRSLHGIEARLDPASCLTCHATETCVACHDGGKRPW